MKEAKKILANLKKGHESGLKLPGIGKAKIKIFTSSGEFSLESAQAKLFNDPVTNKIMIALVEVVSSLICKMHYDNPFTEMKLTA